MKHKQLLELLSQPPIAENTRIAYEKGWQKFVEFCTNTGIKPHKATPQAVAEFLIDCSIEKENSMGSVSIYLAGVSHRFLQMGKPSPSHHPQVKNTLAGLHRMQKKKTRRVKPLKDSDMLKILKYCDDIAGCIKTKRLIALRDAALLAVGFSAALRRSELCGLKTDDIKILSSRKAYIIIRQSKTDQRGQGQRIPILNGEKIKAISRLETWLKESRIETGFVFQTMRRSGSLRGSPMHHSDIPRLVKFYAAKIGLDPKDYAGHSLRSGFVTSAAGAHARLDKIMEVTRHTQTQTVMKYIRDSDSFDQHAGADFL